MLDGGETYAGTCHEAKVLFGGADHCRRQGRRYSRPSCAKGPDTTPSRFYQPNTLELGVNFVAYTVRGLAKIQYLKCKN